MLKKIISGGQTGVDRAALDVAIKYNIPHGGWIPKGRKTEDGFLPLHYNLQETVGTDYPARTKQNIIDAQGTVIISRGQPAGGSRLTQSFAQKMHRPNCHIDLSIYDPFEASLVLHSFLRENSIQVVNVAGPRASHDPGIYFDVKTVLESMLYLFFLDKDREDDFGLPEQVFQIDFPETFECAVQVMEQDLSLSSRTQIARMKESTLPDLYFLWLDYIRRRLGFDPGNDLLLSACRQENSMEFFTVEDGIMDLLKALKKHLESRYRLRVVE